MTEKKLNRSADSRSPLDCGCADVSDTLSIVNLSGGKDSSALLLLMIERGMPIDSVLWANTGMDFPEMAAHIDKLDEHLYRERGLRITRLQYPHSFEWLMLERPLVKQSAINTRKACGQTPTGYGWPRASVRWCTGHLKTDLLEKEATRLKKLHGRQVLHHIGIAADEAKRCREGKRYPLVEWGITEADALQICYDRGYDFGGAISNLPPRFLLVLSDATNFGAAKSAPAPPGTVGASAGYGQPGQGAVRPYPVRPIQGGMERGRAGCPVCKGGCRDMKHLLRRLRVPP